THLAQTELALGTRARMALSTPNYAAQSFDQDKWMARESTLDGRAALDAFVAIAAMNVALLASLSPADRETALTHPEYGALSVDWIVHQMAGHQIHHLKQLEEIAARRCKGGRGGGGRRRGKACATPGPPPPNVHPPKKRRGGKKAPPRPSCLPWP